MLVLGLVLIVRNLIRVAEDTSKLLVYGQIGLETLWLAIAVLSVKYSKLQLLVSPSLVMCETVMVLLVDMERVVDPRQDLDPSIGYLAIVMLASACLLSRNRLLEIAVRMSCAFILFMVLALVRPKEHLPLLLRSSLLLIGGQTLLVFLLEVPKEEKKKVDLESVIFTGLFDRIPGGTLVVDSVTHKVIYSNDLLVKLFANRDMVTLENTLSRDAKLFRPKAVLLDNSDENS